MDKLDFIFFHFKRPTKPYFKFISMNSLGLHKITYSLS